jgi:hypothetical protein
MSDIRPTELVFSRPVEAEFEQLPTLFGEFVRSRAASIDTEYALYAEFVGTPSPPGVNEVRAIIVDKTGACVWVDRQKPGDEDFQRIGVRNPMACCVLVADRRRATIVVSWSPSG